MIIAILNFTQAGQTVNRANTLIIQVLKHLETFHCTRCWSWYSYCLDISYSAVIQVSDK